MSAATGFLERWSKRKREAAAGLPERGAADEDRSPPVRLPDPATVTFDDDFSGFLRQEVQEQVKRMALKKLFHSPQFNVMDGLDVYIDDYSLPDPIDPAFLRSLNQARGLIFDAPEEREAVPAGAVPRQAIDEPAGELAAEGARAVLTGDTPREGDDEQG